MMKSGIYKITIGRWYYYGSTNNFERRKNQHFKMLVENRHYNSKLQRAYNKYQVFNFEVSAYEQDTDKLVELEQLVLDECVGKDNCANLSPYANKCPGFPGKRPSFGIGSEGIPMASWFEDFLLGPKE